MRVVIDKIKKRMEIGKAYSIVAVAEGLECLPKNGRPSISREIENGPVRDEETVLGISSGAVRHRPLTGTWDVARGHAAQLINEENTGGWLLR